ncbi:MAG: C-type lectin domain-containing protein [Phycisphaerales bacterium]
MNARLTAIAAGLSISAAALAQPANDNCASAEALSGYGSFFFDNSAATTDGLPNALCLAFGSDQIDLDLWYCWTATASGPVAASTCGQTTVDTRIAVYNGCACLKGGGILACGDDQCGTQTRVSWTAVAGQTYLIRLGSYPGAVGGAGTFTIESGVLGGPIINPANGHEYYLLQPGSWTAAEAAAVSLAGHLATIDDAAENEWVRVELANFGAQDRRVWIGFNDVASEGTFVWTSGAPVAYTNWNGGEPNNTGGLEHYVELFGSNGQWNDNTNLPAGLTVYGAVEVEASSCYPDCNESGSLTVADFGCFQGKYVLGDLYADCNTSGTLTVADFGCFQGKYVLGCP